MRLTCTVFAIALLGSVGCGDDEVLNDDAGVIDGSVIDSLPPLEIDAGDPDDPARTVITDIDLDPNVDVDLLLVVDNSRSMAEEQSALAGSFIALVNELQDLPGGLPNLHVGVISPDLGAGQFGIISCTGNGDNGALLNATCTNITGSYIIDVDSGGSRTINYTGSLEDAMGCLVQLGINGCGFEQPLEAMRRALNGTNAGNAGFLRQDALLAILHLSDEDDCSASDTAMFDTADSSLDGGLGPLSSYRCFEFGVVCQPDSRTLVGPRQNCQVRDPSPYMFGVDEFITFVRALKSYPGDIIAAGIVGPDTPVAVSTSFDDTPQLDPSCTAASGSAAPAVRLSAFARGFPGRHLLEQVCSNGNFATTLQAVGDLIGDVVTGSPCLQGDVGDFDSATAGVQPDCTVSLLQSAGLPAESEIQIVDCAGSSPPCFSITEDTANCSDEPSQLAVNVTTGGNLPENTHVIVRCLPAP